MTKKKHRGRPLKYPMPERIDASPECFESPQQK